MENQYLTEEQAEKIAALPSQLPEVTAQEQRPAQPTEQPAGQVGQVAYSKDNDRQDGLPPWGELLASKAQVETLEARMDSAFAYIKVLLEGMTALQEKVKTYDVYFAKIKELTKLLN